MSPVAAARAANPSPPDREPVSVPEPAPLAMPCQDLARPFLDGAAPDGPRDRSALAVRLAMLAATAAVGGYFTYEMADILAKGGLSPLELVMAAAFAASFVWVALAAINATAGWVRLTITALRRRRADRGARPLTVALLVPTYNEPPARVLGNAVAMLSALDRVDTTHRFELYVLSDTTDPAIAVAEQTAFVAARRRLPPDARLYYRRRAANVGRKAGNIADWCQRWGSRHEAMIVLDADSLMDADAIVALADAMADDPSAGLIQSIPRLVNAQTLFARTQQFAAAVYGPLLAGGLDLWSRGEGNYWGHNAIIRTRAFASSAGLPELPGRKPFGGHVLSHDFVEAALMRRAGWRVRMAPEIGGSYEEAPPTLVDHAVRDRRWCQGNLQHVGVVGAAGLHPVSRFHLFQGVMAYLSSLLWLLFLVAGAAVAVRARSMPVDYFPEPYVLFPSWPILDSERAFTLLAMTGAILLLPKLLGIASVLARPTALARWGGPGFFLASALTEIVLSAALAPVLMIQQTQAVVRTLAGGDCGWHPQRREGKRLPWRALLRFHAVETVLGAGLVAAMAIALVPLWLAPIAASLALAAPLSALGAVRLARPHMLWRLFAVPERVDPPMILRAAQAHGAGLATTLRRLAAMPAVPRPRPLSPRRNRAAPMILAILGRANRRRLREVAH